MMGLNNNVTNETKTALSCVAAYHIRVHIHTSVQSNNKS